MLCCFRGSSSHQDNQVSPRPPRTLSDHLGVSMTNITGASTLDPDFQALGSAVTLGVLAPSTRRQCKRQCGHSWGDGEMGR